jgi:BirA family biotin operon repressor/biotin-[acetyl-CoA-carboxylase] ligase
LAEPIEFLERAKILAGLSGEAREGLVAVEIHAHLDSTSSHLLRKIKNGASSGVACLAEAQSAGRGRRGRSWVSPFAANLYLSLLWQFSTGVAALSGLSLAVGVAVARALQSLGAAEIGLKWPNDLVWRGRKLGGILLEFDGESAGPCWVVAGVGINVAMPADAESAIDQPWVDLRSIMGAGRLSRNRLAAGVLNEVIAVFARFEHDGFPGVSRLWKQFDQVAGQRILLILPNSTVTGVARGVDDSGALLLETGTGVRRFVAGEISLRVER